MALGAHHSAHSQSDSSEHKPLTFSSQTHPEEHGRHLDIGGKLHHAWPKDAPAPDVKKDTHVVDNSSLGQRNQGKTYVHAFKVGDKHHYVKGDKAPFDSDSSAKHVVKEEFDQIDEISTSSLANYSKKANQDVNARTLNIAGKMGSGRFPPLAGVEKDVAKKKSRMAGITKALTKLHARGHVEPARPKTPDNGDRGYGKGRYMGD
jgi:hypothetical protein